MLVMGLKQMDATCDDLPVSMEDVAVRAVNGWVRALLSNDYDTETQLKEAALDAALSRRSTPAVFNELLPLFAPGAFFSHHGGHNIILGRALMNPSCPLVVLEAGLNAEEHYLKSAVLVNPSTPEEWVIAAYLRGLVPYENMRLPERMDSLS